MKAHIALCQIRVTADKERNIQAATSAVKEAAGNNAQIVVLPEMWNCPYSNDSFPVYAEDIEAGTSTSVAALSEAAKANRVVLVGGSIPERKGDKLYNTCCIFGTDGEMLGKHRKTHLFDIDIPGKITFKESETLSPGPSLTVVDTCFGRIGVGICYDLRFPEQAQVYGQRGAQLLIYPGAFNMTTGPLHWELLQRARALDNMLFVASCSPARDEDAGYVAWGHSMVVGPWGAVVAAAGPEEGIVYAELDYGEIDARRASVPALRQKRLDLYELVDKAPQNG